MKQTFKKLFCTLLSAVICISTFGVTAFAAEDIDRVENIVLDEVAEVEGVASTYSTTVLSDGGVLANSTKTLTFYVPESSTYTFTMSVSQISGSGGVWAILQKSGGSAIMDRTITSSYQKRFNMTSGTWYLQLTSAPGTAAYSVTIHKTF